jgi:hypothetical protein
MSLSRHNIYSMDNYVAPGQLLYGKYLPGMLGNQGSYPQLGRILVALPDSSTLILEY